MLQGVEITIKNFCAFISTKTAYFTFLINCFFALNTFASLQRCLLNAYDGFILLLQPFLPRQHFQQRSHLQFQPGLRLFFLLPFLFAVQ